MATPNVGILTNAGKNLIDQVNAGQTKITFSKIVFSSMNNNQLTDEQIKALTTVAPQEIVVNNPEVTLDNNTGETRIRATGNNETLTDGVYVKTYAVFAKDDSGNEILYGITVSPNPNYLPEYDGVTPQAVTYSYKVNISNTSNITFTNSNDIYVSDTDLAEALQPYAKTVDVNQQLDKKVNIADMRKPASDVAGIEEVNAKQDKIGYTPADDSAVVHYDAIPSSLLRNYLDSGTDLNTITNPGIFPFNQCTFVNDINSTTKWGAIFNNVLPNQIIKQEIIQGNGQVYGYRIYNGGTKLWSSWLIPADDSKVLHSTVTELDSTDLNTILTAGFYRLVSGTNGMPNADAWTIYQVIPLSSTNGVQLAYETNNTVLGLRSWATINGVITFNNWTQFADDSTVVHTSDTSNWQKQAMFNPGNYNIDGTTQTTDFTTLLRTKYNKAGVVYIRDNDWPSNGSPVDAVVICEGGGWWYAYGVTPSNQFVHRQITSTKDTGWTISADDSKVAHLSGANNFDTVPTVNNNPLLLASSLPSDLARTGSDQEFTGKNTFDTAPIDKTTGNPYITKDGVPSIPSDVARTGQAQTFTQPQTFSIAPVINDASTSKGDNQAATMADLKSLENSAWHIMSGSSEVFQSYNCWYKINRDNKRLEIIVLGATNLMSGDNHTVLDLSSIITSISKFSGSFNSFSISQDGAYTLTTNGAKLITNSYFNSGNASGQIIFDRVHTNDRTGNPAYVYYDDLQDAYK